MTTDRDDLMAAFAAVVAASGRVRDALVGVSGDAEVLRECAHELDRVADRLVDSALVPGEPDAVAALTVDPRYGIRDRGLTPRHTITGGDGEQLFGVTTIERHFDGVGAVHGGAIALLFDDLLGRLANAAPRPMARTAYLHLDFRRPVPWGRQLQFSCRVAAVEGRKRFLEGELMLDGQALAGASGLWVELRPSAPGCGSAR
jgi:acyl-coenzyme A thioesterase PaaI-like protein